MSKKLKKVALIDEHSAKSIVHTRQEVQPARGEATSGLDESARVVTVSSVEVRASALLSMRIRVENKLMFEVDGYEAVEIAALMEHMPRYLNTLYSARQKIARAVKLKAERLPIACGVFEGEVVMSILAPPDKEPIMIIDAAQPVCDAITERWRSVAEAAQQASANTKINSDPAGKLEPGGSGEQSDVKTQPAIQQSVFDPVGKTLLSALTANHEGGTVRLNFTTARQPFELPAVAVPPVPIPQAPHITVGGKRTVICEIYRRIGPNHCTVREADVTKLKKAVFSTNGTLSALINMFTGCPGVHLEIQDYISDNPEVPPPYDFLILRVIDLAPAWHFEPLVIDFLYNCLAEIDALMPAPLQRLNR